MKVKKSQVAQSCPTLSDPMDCNPPGSSVHGIFQARVLEWAVDYSDLIKDENKIIDSNIQEEVNEAKTEKTLGG